MEMINVLKRLAELDAGNPNVIAEATQVALDECGPMGIMGGGMSHTPANISITAGSGPELSNMLKDIMSLAGVHKVEPHDMGIEHEPAALVAEPVAAVGPAASHGEIMRGVMDRMNPEMDDDEEGDEEEYEEQTDESWSNTPESPQPKKAFRANEFANMENQSGTGKHRINTQPRATTMEESLMAEWQQFVTENTGVTNYDPLSQDGTRKELLAKYRKTKDPKYADAARRAGATHREIQDAKDGADEGHHIVPSIDTDRYEKRPGLEGPFRTKSGKVVYYDRKEGKYYDPDSDFYIAHDDYQALDTPRTHRGMEENQEQLSPTRASYQDAMDALKNPEAKKIWNTYGQYTPSDYKNSFTNITDNDARQLAHYARMYWYNPRNKDELKGRVIHGVLMLQKQNPIPTTDQDAVNLVDRWIELAPKRYGGYDDARGEMIRMVIRDPKKRKQFETDIAKREQELKTQSSMAEGMAENSELMKKIESALDWFKDQYGEDADVYAAYLSVAKQLGYGPESEEFKNAWKSVVGTDHTDYTDYSRRQGEWGMEESLNKKMYDDQATGEGKIREGKMKCCCEKKGKAKCPVHNKKK